MAYAIISLGGKQYRVQEGERLLVDRVPTEEGKTFYPDVLMLGGDGTFELAPKAQVTVRVVGSALGNKVTIGKYKPKSGYRRKTGFRAKLSQIEIESIGGAAKRSAPAEKEAPAKKEAEAPAKAEAPKQEAEASPAKLPAGYGDMTIADLNKSVGEWSAEQVEAALEYERAHANRKGAIAALEARKDD
jgi:large subunit ribosomal protein L21